MAYEHVKLPKMPLFLWEQHSVTLPNESIPIVLSPVLEHWSTDSRNKSDLWCKWRQLWVKFWPVNMFSSFSYILLALIWNEWYHFEKISLNAIVMAYSVAGSCGRRLHWNIHWSFWISFPSLQYHFLLFLSKSASTKKLRTVSNCWLGDAHSQSEAALESFIWKPAWVALWLDVEAAI